MPPQGIRLGAAGLPVLRPRRRRGRASHLEAARERLDALFKEAEKALEEVLEAQRRRRRAEEEVREAGPYPGGLGSA